MFVSRTVGNVEGCKEGDAPSRRSSRSGCDTLAVKRQTETEEYFPFVRRVLRALAARVGAADPEALREMVALRGELENCIEIAVAGLRQDETGPASWGEIARALDVTRQAAQQRYAKVGAGRRRPGGQPGGWR